MNTRKLLLGLTVSAAVSAGFGASVLPASADPRTFQVTLLGGAAITVNLDGPPGTPVDQVRVPGVDLPLVAISEVTQAPAPEPAPATAEQPVEDAAVVAEEQEAQQATGKKKRGPAKRTGSVVQSAEQLAAKQEAATRRAATTLRNADGSPAVGNPSFVLALPGLAPIGVPNFFIEKFRIPPFLLPIYQAAGIEYGIRWEVLAAINEIETDYGRNLNVSSAGALGWMQFIPSSWTRSGVDANRDGKKDPYNPVDAVFAAARYLKAAGAEQDIRKAIFAYTTTRTGTWTRC